MDGNILLFSPWTYNLAHMSFLPKNSHLKIFTVFHMAQEVCHNVKNSCHVSVHKPCTVSLLLSLPCQTLLKCWRGAVSGFPEIFKEVKCSPWNLCFLFLLFNTSLTCTLSTLMHTCTVSSHAHLGLRRAIYCPLLEILLPSLWYPFMCNSRLVLLFVLNCWNGKQRHLLVWHRMPWSVTLLSE